MEVDLVVWALLVLGVVLMALLAFVVLRHVRQLGRERAVTTTDMTRRLARLQVLRATRGSRTR